MAKTFVPPRWIFRLPILCCCCTTCASAVLICVHLRVSILGKTMHLIHLSVHSASNVWALDLFRLNLFVVVGMRGVVFGVTRL